MFCWTLSAVCCTMNKIMHAVRTILFLDRVCCCCCCWTKLDCSGLVMSCCRGAACLYRCYKAVWLLLQDSVSVEDIAQADKLLRVFCLKFKAYYGKIHCIDDDVYVFIADYMCMFIELKELDTSTITNTLHYSTEGKQCIITI